MQPGNPVSPTRADLAAQGVRFLLASYVDLHGVPKAKMVPIDHLDRMMKGSELFTGAALDGVPQEVSDEEVAAHPDLDSARRLPWSPEVAWLPSDLYTKGAPFEACSRTILKRARREAADMGFFMNLGIEAEFFVLQEEPGGFRPMSTRHHLKKPAYDVPRLLDNLPWLGELVDAMNSLGWGVYSFDHEDGIGQFEIDFSYFEALRMADNFTFLRLMANEIARKHGAFATFMPKPYGNRAGSGAHFNVSLADPGSGRNLFVPQGADPRGCGLSKLGYQFIAGVLRHLPAICAVVAPTVNSYKRLVKQGSMSGFTWAPVFCCYGNNNRTNTIRVPLGGQRIELRAADSACNPYLGAAMVLAAGLEGIREELDPGDPHTDNMYLKTPAELRSLGIRELPKTLEQAIDAFEADPLSRRVFGEQMFRAWVDYKREEWQSYITHVSDWEVERYLKLF